MERVRRNRRSCSVSSSDSPFEPASIGAKKTDVAALDRKTSSIAARAASDALSEHSTALTSFPISASTCSSGTIGSVRYRPTPVLSMFPHALAAAAPTSPRAAREVGSWERRRQALAVLEWSLVGLGMAGQASALLCVDDDRSVLQLMKDYFSHQGFLVVTATSGLEAFLQAARWAPRAVILDLFIPRLGGLETLERLRKLDPELPVILLSGVPHALDMLAEAGVDVAGAFAKPVDLEQISQTLAEAGVTPSTPAADLATAAATPSQVRVLVVDDEPEFRKVLADYLEERGFEALGVWDGEEALRRIREFKPHVVMLDILLPGINGIETLRRMRTLVPEACVIMVSGHGDLDTAKRALEIGAVDYVHKPVDLGYLDTLLGVGETAS